MKLDLTPVRRDYVTPAFVGDDHTPMDPALTRRMRRPMLIGSGVIAVLVLGLGLWASLVPLASGITAPAEIRVESNLKTIRHREAGTVRQILVKDGDHVKLGQPLMVFDDVEARAAVDVYQNQYDSALTQSVRYQAEAKDSTQFEFPPELTSRMSDPRVAGMIRDQQFLFTTRLQAYQSQISILSQRLDQLQTQIAGDQAQVASVEEQVRLTDEELDGYKILNEKGYAPKTLILRYQRSLADLEGKKGSLESDIARLRQQMGETRIQMASVRDQRESQAAEGVRDSQTKLADASPRLTEAKETLDRTTVRSPADGYVFNLTQFTVGGVVGSGEVLMQVVPAAAPMIVTALIKPEEVDNVHVGMEAQVKLTGLNPRFNSPLPAKVVVVSADRTTNEKTGAATFRVDLRIDPKDLRKLEPGVQLNPGMPAQVLIVTGKRTVMGYLVLPITETLHDAFREH
jgi:HlyD family type I secretion membrane fusion protein